MDRLIMLNTSLAFSYGMPPAKTKTSTNHQSIDALHGRGVWACWLVFMLKEGAFQ